jgi:tryptophan halogenase
MKNVVILGGGTAGWLTALYLNKHWKDISITLIESSEIGILGAGEGSTQLFTQLLRELNIDEKDFINQTNSTIKIGIDFERWRNDNSKYTNYFIDDWALNDMLNLYDLNYYTQINSAYAYHFDARLVAEYFKNISIQRGVNHIDTIVTDIKLDINNNVELLCLNNNTTIKVDFIFDCSGFARNIIGKTYKSEWMDYTEFLKVNSAIPFFLPQTDNSKVTKTRAIAMKYGWMWQIPLQNRWGCGYIFDNHYINSAEAKIEVEELLGYQIESNRTIEFNPGSFKDVWIGNCIAIGLSSGFLEPLEATSIMTTILQLDRLKKYWDSNNINQYNIEVQSINEENMAFIYYHYMCDRNDTDFWKQYNSRHIHPNILNKVINGDKDFIINDEIELKEIFKHSLYNTHTWKTINYGARSRSKNIL